MGGSQKMSCVPFVLTLLVCFFVAGADVQKADEPYAPHTPTLIFYLAGVDATKDDEAIRASIAKLKSASTVEINKDRSYARIRFDSHVVSYHQVAQAISDAGQTVGKKYDPCLVFVVSEYAKSGNTSKVDRVFAGKRLNGRVHVKPLDPDKGVFAIHFLPLEVDAKSTAPQGFNGGHLHHPISDPAPRGLGLPSEYATKFDSVISEILQKQRGTDAPSVRF